MWRDSKGVVYVEFLLVFPPLFLLFLVILQLAILSATDLGVRHAASSAVRSAIVVIPDDPDAYEGESPPDEIPRDAKCANGVVQKMDKLLSSLGISDSKLPKNNRCPGGPRMAAVRFAATSRMLPFSPNLHSLGLGSLSSVVSKAGDAGWILGAALYSHGTTAVSFPAEPGSDKRRANLEWKNNEELTVRVTYMAHCGIPIASLLMCDSGRSLLAKKELQTIFGGFRQSRAVRKRLRSSGSALQTMTADVGNSSVFMALMASSNRFMVLTADATLPVSSAPYDYQKKPKKDD